jgi:hypothetical protein
MEENKNDISNKKSMLFSFLNSPSQYLKKITYQNKNKETTELSSEIFYKSVSQKMKENEIFIFKNNTAEFKDLSMSKSMFT